MAQKPTAPAVRRTGLFPRIALFFYTHVKIAALLWAVVLISGVVVYGWLIKREGFPSVQVPVGIVQVGYPLKGAAAIDAEIIQPIDAAISRSPVVESVTANSHDNFAVMTVRFNGSAASSSEGIENIKGIIGGLQLPPGVQIQYQEINAAKFLNKYEAILAVTSSTIIDPRQLYDAAGIIAKAANEGPSALGSGFTAEVLPQYVEGTAPDGTLIALQRNADRYGEAGAGQVIFRNAVSIGISAPAEFDAFDLQKRLETFTQTGKTPDTAVSISASFAPDITRQVNGLQISLLEGLAIILVVSLVLLHFRAGIVTGLSMVTVLLLTLLVLYALGYTLNTITLFALILCLGLIVDDTTIVAEAIDRQSTRTKNKKRLYPKQCEK